MSDHATHDELQLLSVGSLAELLELSPRQVRRMDSTGKLPVPLRLGRSLRWRRAEILAWLDAGLPGRTEWQTMKLEFRGRDQALTRAV